VPQTDPGGFEVLKVDLLRKGVRVDVERYEVRGPDGSTFDREIIHHPGAVAVVPVNDRGNILLVRQFRAATRKWLFEIPAGTRDVEGEPPQTTAHRELLEEVGVIAGRVEELGRFWNSPGFCDEETFLYLATELTESQPDRSGAEELSIEVREVSFDDVEKLLFADQPVDLQTLIGISLARRALEGR
jgi:ADP-ribose pyrophosphatase